MGKKIFIVLDEKQRMEVERIELDKDPRQALSFLLKVVAPQLRKRTPCMDGALKMRRGGG